MEQSERGKLNTADMVKWLKNIAIFFIPVLILYIAQVSATINLSGFNWNVFIPSLFNQGVLVLYVLNAITDLLNKLLKGNKPV